MKFAVICTVLALAYSANTLSVGGYGFKGPIFGSAPSVDSKSDTEVKDGDPITFADSELAHKPTFDIATAPQPEVESKAVQQTLAEEAEVVKNDTTHVESESEMEKEDVDSITLGDTEFVQQPTDTEQKPDILVKPSFLDKSPNPSILDPY